ncbi:Serine/threonine-protein kinase ATR [Linum perenne]
MATSLSSLVHELRERIAASSSTQPANGGDDGALETRFRAVLPNLLHAYVVPSSSASEREVIAVLKLITNVARNFPGVFYQGKASVVLPVIGRILPFFAEPAFCSRHGVIFETVGSLLSLLRTGERDAYCQFFLDTVSAVQDLSYVACLANEGPGISTDACLKLKCFTESFSRISTRPGSLSDLPPTIKPIDGFGILVNIMGKSRWQPFAAWMIRILSKCLTEGTLYVEGLPSLSNVSATCSLLCYGDADLHMACFDFAGIMVSVIDCEIVPLENLILSITAILSKDTDLIPLFRNKSYDSSIGSCLDVLHSICPDYAVKLTAADVINVFPRVMWRTKSQELKVAMCSSYKRIVRTCPPQIWKPESLLDMLFIPEPCDALIDCFQVALSVLGSDRIDGRLPNTSSVHLSTSDDKSTEQPRVGEKRHINETDYIFSKRLKLDDDMVDPDASELPKCKWSHIVNIDSDDAYAGSIHASLLSLIEQLKCPSTLRDSVRPEMALTALSMLCIAFSRQPDTNLWASTIEVMHSWILWICNQVEQANPAILDIRIYLEGIHSILLTQSSFSESRDRLAKFKNETADHWCKVLKLPWTHTHVVSEPFPQWKTKQISLQVAAKLGPKLTSEGFSDILDLGLKDEAAEVRSEAILSILVSILLCGIDLLPEIFKRLECLGREQHDSVKKVIPFCLGYLSCLCGCCSGGYDDEGRSRCKLYLNIYEERKNQTLEHLLQGFWCPKCDQNVLPKNRSLVMGTQQLGLPNCSGFNCDFVALTSVFFNLLYGDSSEEIQVACVKNIQRTLLHLTADDLIRTRSDWIKCLEFCLNNASRAICTFLTDAVFTCLFVEENSLNRGREESFMDVMKRSLVAAEDPEAFETVLESILQIMVSVDLSSRIYLLSLLLLVDQLDNPHMIIGMAASKLIHKSCLFHLKAGPELLLSKVVHTRNQLFEYLSMNLVSRPKLVKVFAETVLGVETKDLIEKMIPLVLPKLVVSWQENEQAVETLFELAKCLNTEMVTLVVNLLPKVLAYALHQTDRQELLSTLQFYHDQTRSDSQEIFAAALPALLDELVCFLDGCDSFDIKKRLLRVPEMIKEIAKVLTGSEDLPCFLRNHFVGLLNSMDRKMLHAEDVSLQIQALQRIRMLIEMMGSHLSTYVPKLMVLLMHAIDKESLQSEGLSVLHYFIEQLASQSPSSIKHVVSQVFAALVPFLERYKESSSAQLKTVVNILEELVLKNRIVLKQHIREFPLLPSIPLLMDVNTAIQEARGSLTLKDQLRIIFEGLNHENLNVRYMMVCELSKLLNLRKGDITALITGEVSADMDVLSSLITSLLRGCAEESRTVVGQRLKLVCADCLGALGAVDPAKVISVPSKRFTIECSDDDLIFELIHKHLARAFRAAPDTVVQDSAALAIQELLKIAGCEASLDENVAASLHAPRGRSADGSGAMNNRGQRLWDRFSNYVKEIIAPCLTSRFQLPNVADSATAGPIYRPSLSFRRWIYFWIKKLTAHATGSRASIFKSCRGIVRHDMQIAIYLLPYLVLNAVCHGTKEARHSITEEVLSVLSAALSENSGATIHVGGQTEVCIQAVFTLLDNLGQWVDDVEQDLALSQSTQSTAYRKQASKSKEQGATSLTDQDQLLVQCKHVSELLDAVPKVTLARASFRCQAYARSLMYFESHVREKSGSFNPAAERSGNFEDGDVSYLMEIYSCLDEPDGLSGLASLRKSMNLQDQLLLNKKAGNWAEVLTSCEQALQTESISIQRHSDVLNCLLNMCHLQAMVTHVDGLVSRFPRYKKTWCMQGVQAAWRLGRWDLMDEYLNGADDEGLLCSGAESNASFDINVAKILQAMMKKNQLAVAERIGMSKQALIAPLAAAGMDSYMRAYPLIVKLHLLQELEGFHSLLINDSFLEKRFHLSDLEFTKLVQNLENRISITQPSLWTREPLLAFRRLVFTSSGLGAQVGNCWLQYAKLCRSAGHYETANRAILEAQSSGALNVHVEKAKLLWNTRRSDGAIAELQQSLLHMPVEIVGTATRSSITNLSLVPLNPQSSDCKNQTLNDNQDVAKTLLLYTRWIHYTGQKQKEDVIALYSRVRELQPLWDKGFFYLAKYFDEVLVDARKRQEDNSDLGSRASASNNEKRWWFHLPDVLLFYAKGLHKGHKNLFQALPRLLTLWFEFGSIYQRSRPISSNGELAKVHAKVLTIIRGCLKDLPTYQWLTVLPQLVSRICHQNEDVVLLVKRIITSVLREYPQQALWITAAVSKSKVSSRREAAAAILQEAKKGFGQGNSGSILFAQFASLIDHLIKLCFHPGQPKSRTINIATEFSALKRMMPMGIIMPIQQSLSFTLPTYTMNESLASDVFSASEFPMISGIADEAEILSSLQRPKKVILMGSDGIERPFLCKPKDDLRKDARMMEFTAMINRLLSKYPESRRRKLYIRTFAVIPLTEDCGMVEWVPHTRGLRHILQDIYSTCGKFDRQKTHPQIKRIYDQCQGKMPEDEMLKYKLLPLFPPVFHKWFLTTFSEPAAWFRARVAYAHTTAVWSMVGHIVGLGDRHGENILFDSTTGDCVHVDFSCLFDKGLQLEKPELVPFRLTQNMIDGLGITGYEGIFLKVCEITLSVLRTHRETLMSVLETFIHDPLVEWTKSHKSSGTEVQNPHAQRAISNIEARLQGVVVGVGAAPSLPLAVEGQARRLIAEAVSHRNLGKMYIWWMPWF